MPCVWVVGHGNVVRVGGVGARQCRVWGWWGTAMPCVWVASGYGNAVQVVPLRERSSL
ncbi:MAG: hypothetical protein KatS3mg055_2571 [Chloroflexus sp.]|nr:MAG: hypothetical protein KatS3mg055_2571 [Chloroflexus sp.]